MELEKIDLDKFYLILHPRPAYVIGSGKFGEKVNFMAASWVTPMGEEPPLVCVAIGKGSLTNELIHEYRQFSVNILPIDRVNELYTVGTVSGREMDKTKILKAVEGDELTVPIVEDAIAVLECELWDKIESNDVTLFIGQVVNAKANPKYFNQKTGWNIRDNPVPLHNWGKGFHRVGQFIMAKTLEKNETK
ncbi:MAG: flavin reductase family protein [archaeon YNP-WB-040]|jgi:flavin reductase (DIM6/NTAB) family NADH-FMN oxidoreductase RutF|nr:flavin reductase family protein [Candidatus Culexarchaeum yellowstonense]